MTDSEYKALRDAHIKADVDALYANATPPSREEIKSIFKKHCIGVLFEEDVVDPEDWAFSVRFEFHPSPEDWAWKYGRWSARTPAQDVLHFYGKTS